MADLDIASQIAVPIAVALLAFAGSMMALNSRRKADRRAEQAVRLREAIDRITGLCRRLADEPGSVRLLDIYEASWGFGAASSRRRDLAVEQWVNGALVDLFGAAADHFVDEALGFLSGGSVDQLRSGQRRREHEIAVRADKLIGRLNEWRLGATPTSWFARELKKARRSPRPAKSSVEVPSTGGGPSADSYG